MKEEKLNETKNEKLNETKKPVDTKNEKLNETKNEKLNETEKPVDTKNEKLNETEKPVDTKNEEVKNTPKKADLTNRKYSTLLDAAKANGIDSETLKKEAIKRLKDVIENAYESIKRLHESKTQVSDFIKMSRAEQSNKVLQISSGSLEQRLGYDRETYTSVEKATTQDEAVLYTLLACIGWDATARLCGINDAPTSKKNKNETNSTVTLNF